MSETALEKILKLLLKGNYSTSEIAFELDLPLGTVRSTISLLKRTGFTEPVPEKKRGTPYKLTEKGREYIEQKIAERKDNE